MSPPRFREGIRLAATRSAINCAGLFVVSTLTGWGVRTILRDSVLMTEELVTNAVKLTGVMDERPRWTEIDHLNFITVRLLGLEASVVIEVWDCDPETPTLAAPAGAVANRGSYLTGGGKVVWAELPVLPGASSVESSSRATARTVRPTLTFTARVPGRGSRLVCQAGGT